MIAASGKKKVATGDVISYNRRKGLQSDCDGEGCRREDGGAASVDRDEVGGEAAAKSMWSCNPLRAMLQPTVATARAASSERRRGRRASSDDETG